MKQGALLYDKQIDRYKIRFDPEHFSDGLHCGESFEVFVDGKWKHTRIEMTIDENWYLVGIKCKDLTGLVIQLNEDN